jgi:predicted amidohydrolase YtcJ
VLIRQAEVEGVPGLDVRVDRERILEIGPGLVRLPGEEELDARGGAVMPGLHDEHVHLRAWGAARASVSLQAVAGPAEFDRVIRAAASELPPGAWLRGIGWHESTAGPVDRRRLDALTGGRPARLQHRTGVLWVLNSAALAAIGEREAAVPAGAPGGGPGFERDEHGEPTGRLWRMDGWLRERVPQHAGVDLRVLGVEALGSGVTGFTDATPGRDQRDADELAALGLPQRLVLMAPPGLTAPSGVTLGPTKLLLDDDTLPPVSELAATIAASAGAAIHCVTAEQLVVAVAALEMVGGARADRIEHAGVVPPGFAERLAALRATVVTNPGFLAERGDIYRREVSAEEQSWLYPCRSLLAAGVKVAAATDAPFGPDDPWTAISAAINRRTPAGAILGAAERVDPIVALKLFQGERRTAVGEPADLCVMQGPLAGVLAAPSAEWVRAVVVHGRVFAKA